MKDNVNSGQRLQRTILKERLIGTVKKILCLSAVSMTLGSPVYAQEVPDAAGSKAQNVQGFKKQDVQNFINELIKEHGFSRPELEKVFASIEYKPRIVELISTPAERKLAWWEYRNLFINDRRINQGVAFWVKHRKILEKAEKDYGVSPAVIIGILGIETGFGRNSGGFRVVDALSTLGFGYPRRASFFKKELREFLILAREQGFDPLTLKGSYAGAMGIPQFMPSSYRAYAIDYDGSGQADIWGSPADAIGSIASYLHKHKWAAGKIVAAKAEVKGEKFTSVISQNPRPKKTFDEAKKFGWQSEKALSGNAKVRGIELEGKGGAEYWLTMHNFYVITRYNRSDMYAMAVWQLGSHVEQKLQVRDDLKLAKK